ncbi:protein FAR-RED IMPAIRED RESPONSE 1-like [Lolium rigidum]|uniref:protein FAR-RED IMPAIRED RESPONSE 1-like n=1 Tax=Lolium rigidum TaxID=89674 RepID=UPI001F5C4F7C|nr:protein FAR-RED IMPAIRED RESPONSE 1-like [Lolium rigidum]
MGAADPEFTYSVQVDDESRIKKLLWTTEKGGYRVLLREVKVEKFERVFREFVKMMSGKNPVTILTDQCRAMEHVLRKTKERLGALYGKNNQFKVDFHRIMNQMLTKEEFEGAWIQMLRTNGQSLTSVEFCARMTSTQQSESVNHMLKTYVPPGSAMHVFVKQFNKLLYDRDAEESFQEKRTRLGGVVYKVGEPMEKHTANIYTRTMFEKFQEVMYKSGSYYVDELVPGEIYVAKKFNSESLEKWCKVEYKVSVKDGYYACECGMYEHMGMLCCHVVKVLVHLRCTEIPAPHVMKRWTVDARDVLPLHLVQYQKDQGLMTSFSFRHSQLYLNCMEVVRIGDVNVDTYTTAMECIKVLVPKLKLIAVEMDGLGLEQRLSAKKARVDIGPAQLLVEQTAGSKDCGVAIILDAALIAPSKNRSGSRPTTSRDKPPYETTSKRTRFCTICGQSGNYVPRSPTRSCEALEGGKMLELRSARTP